MTLTISKLLEHAVSMGASNVHLSPNMPPMFRIAGNMTEVRIGLLNLEQIQKLLSTLMNQEQQEKFSKDLEINFSYDDVDNNLRVKINIFSTLKGPVINIRLIPNKIYSLNELESPSIIKNFTELSKGLILIAGGIGSGKSTTLAAMIDHINKHKCVNIITIEDPIEFIHIPKKSLINQRAIGTNTQSFSNALKEIINEDPDIIVISDLTNIESIKLLFSAIEAGQLVFATINSLSTLDVINRIINLFPPDEKSNLRNTFSKCLEGIIIQKLITRANGKGRVAAYEVMVATSEIKSLIQNDKISEIDFFMQHNGRSLGMIMMEDYIQDLILREIITSNYASPTNLRSHEKATNDINYKSPIISDDDF